MILEASVDLEEALSFLGYKGQIVSQDLEVRLARAAQICEHEMVARGCYCVFSCVVERLACDDGFRCCTVVKGADFTSEDFAIWGCDLANHIEGCDQVALLAVTLGAESDMILRRERARGATDSLLVDACASSLVEQAANALNAQIVREAKKRGYSCRTRFSPGYGDVALSCQAQLVEACRADKTIGVRVSDSDMLIPMKSITAIIGLIRDGATTQSLEEMKMGADSAPDLAADSAPEEASVEASEEASVEASEEASDICERCRSFSICSIREQGRTCYGSKA